LVGSDDYGRDITGVQNLRKKHKRLDMELGSHEPQIQLVRDKGVTLMATSDMGRPEIMHRMQTLEQNWDQIRSLTGNRYRYLCVL
jgi:spectrin alpha